MSLFSVYTNFEAQREEASVHDDLQAIGLADPFISRPVLTGIKRIEYTGKAFNRQRCLYIKRLK